MKKEDKQPNQDNQTVAEEKSRVGGDYNSGVTSEDPAEKEEIEKQASLGKNQPKSQKEREQHEEGLKQEDLPDSTNTSTGKMGSGQRQDSN
jgi:hypothetical protein